MIAQLSVSLVNDQAAFAGDVEGKQIASTAQPRLSKRSKYRWAVFPFRYTRRMSAAVKIGVRSLADAFFMLLSALLVISQEAITSQRAIRWSSKNCLFSSTGIGSGLFKTADNTFQNRFWGCP